MTSANFQPATLKQFKSSLESDSGSGSAPEFLLMQDLVGNVHAFQWQLAERYGVQPEQVTGQLDRAKFYPTDSAAYFTCLRRVLETLTPEQAQFGFYWDNRSLLFDLVISPVLVPNAPATLVTVVGKLLNSEPSLSTLESSAHLTPHPDRYQKLLTEISWNVRRTLDLQTIWQQTVQGSGQSLERQSLSALSLRQSGNPGQGGRRILPRSLCLVEWH